MHGASLIQHSTVAAPEDVAVADWNDDSMADHGNTRAVHNQGEQDAPTGGPQYSRVVPQPSPVHENPTVVHSQGEQDAPRGGPQYSRAMPQSSPIERFTQSLERIDIPSSSGSPRLAQPSATPSPRTPKRQVSGGEAADLNDAGGGKYQCHETACQLLLMTRQQNNVACRGTRSSLLRLGQFRLASSSS